jgi:cytochrome c553
LNLLVILDTYQKPMIEFRQERKIMKFVRALAPAALFASVFCAGAHAEDTKTSVAAPHEAVPAREFQAKVAYCQTCHGLSARGFIGTAPMPRLAGQQPDYIKNQLQAFIDRRRLNPVMGNVAHVLSPAMVDALSTHFKDLDPPPYGGAPKDLMSAGEKIYHEGVPSAGVPACDPCHGQDAHGLDQFPRLAGQLHGYVIAKLQNWPKERGQDPKAPDSSEIMGPIAEKLTKEQIAEVAAYVSDLK